MVQSGCTEEQSHADKGEVLLDQSEGDGEGDDGWVFVEGGDRLLPDGGGRDGDVGDGGKGGGPLSESWSSPDPNA